MNACKYNVIPQLYRESIEVTPDQKCNGWTAINKGDSTVIINGSIELKPFPPGHPELSGESFGVQGNIGEIFQGHITIDIGTGSTPAVLIVQKIYL